MHFSSMDEKCIWCILRAALFKIDCLMINGVERHRTTLFSADDRRNISRRRWSVSVACCTALHGLTDTPARARLHGISHRL